MKQIRRNVFETNSSSTHSITLAAKPMCMRYSLPIDGDGYVTLVVNGFCSTDTFVEPIDKLGYVMQVYAAKNHISLNSCGRSKEFVNALHTLYETEEFKDLEAQIIERLGPSCKGIRFEEDYGWGYIDDSCDAVDEFCTHKVIDPLDFIFNDYYLHYHYDG